MVMLEIAQIEPQPHYAKEVTLPGVYETEAPITQLLRQTAETTTKAVHSVTPEYSPAVQKAMEVFTQKQMGQWLQEKSIFVQEYIPALRAATVAAELSYQGQEIAPKGTSEYAAALETELFGAAFNYEQLAQKLQEAREALINIEKGQYERELEYQGRLTEAMADLNKAAAAGAISKAQLEDVTGQYEELYEKYLELLNQPPQTVIPSIEWPDFSGWLDTAKWAIVGIGALVGVYLIAKLVKRK